MCRTVCDLHKCVFTLNDEQAGSPQPRAFLPGHQKEYERHWGEGGCKEAGKGPVFTSAGSVLTTGGGDGSRNP